MPMDDDKIKAATVAVTPLERARALFKNQEIDVTGWTDAELIARAELYHKDVDAFDRLVWGGPPQR